MEFGKRLAEIRLGKGISQEDLASKADTTPRHISDLETGVAAPTNDEAIALAKALGVSVEDLLGTVLEAETTVVSEDEAPKANEPKKVKILKSFGFFGKAEALFDSIGGFLCIVAYILVGIFWKGPTGGLGWACGWTLILLPVVIGSIFTCIRLRKFAPFQIAPLIVIIYCGMGIIGNAYGQNLWHPYWLLFLIIPFVHYLTACIDHRKDFKR